MRKMRLKKHNKSNLCVYLVFFAFLILAISFNLKNNSFSSENEEFVNKVLQASNSHLVVEENDDILYALMGKLNNIEIENPVVMIDKVFNYDSESEIMPPDTMEFSYVQNVVVDKPRVYIYSTHPSEGYNNTDFNVVNASLTLQEKLNSMGIQTLVESRNVDTYMKENTWITNAYTASKIFLKEALNNYEFDLIIDLHRDSVPSTVSTKTTINGKDYAKVMFVTNKDCLNNYALSEQLSKIANEKYPTISRGLFERGKVYYNQEINSRVVLIELGSTQNTYEEVNNSIDALANVIKEILK